MLDNDSNWLAKEFEKSHKNRRWIRIGSSVGICLLIGVSFLVYHSEKHNQAIKLANSFTNVPSDGTSGSSTASNLPSDSTSNSQEQANPNQEEAQDKAAAAQDEANAEQDIKNAENMQTNLNSEVPPSTSSTSSSSSTFTPPNPALCSGIQAQEQAATASLTSQNQQISASLSGQESAEQADVAGGNYQAADQISASIDTETKELLANGQQIESIDAQYNPQLAANECS